MTRVILSFFGAIFSWLTLALFFGALTLGALFWMYSRDLPSYELLAQYTPPTISRIYDGEGKIIDEFAHERRIYTPIADIPPLVKEAFVSAEDKNFYLHQGFDARGIFAAIVEAVRTRGRIVRGASTITQQVAKNFLLSGNRTIERKIKELILANRISNAFSKDRVLELYLNEIYLGANSYGVAAAAQTYFNKTLSQLTPQEAAYLAALPKKPSDLHPVRDMKAAIARRNYVLNQMYLNGYLPKAEAEKAEAAPLKSVQNGDYPAFREKLPPRDYFTDEIRRELSDTFGQQEFFGGGLTIRATVDPEMQADGAAALRHGLEKYDRSRGVWRGTGKTIPAADLKSTAKWQAALANEKVARDIPGWYPAVVLSTDKTTAEVGIENGPDGTVTATIPAEDVTWARKSLGDGKLSRKARVPADLVSPGDVVYVAHLADKNGKPLRWSLRQIPEIEGAFMAMDAKTGRVIAMQGGFSYQHSVFNRATQAKRQPGSAFKPFVYAAALDSGFTPATIVIDAPIEVDTPQGLWRPKNSSNKFYGPTLMRTGLIHSRNLMTIRIAQEIGMDTVARYAERFGVYEPMQEFLANSLGSQETTLFNLMGAYSMIANGGERVEPSLVDRVQDRFGKTIYRHDQRVCEDCNDPNLPPDQSPMILSNRQRVIDPITDYQLINMMKGVVTEGTASGVIHLPVPIAGKTGTTNDSKDVWFIGFSSNIVAGCYMGFDTPRPLGHGAYGASMCGPVFQEFMQQAIKKYGGSKFKVPPGGHFLMVDRYSGALVSDNNTGGGFGAPAGQGDGTATAGTQQASNAIPIYFRDGEQPLLGMGGMIDGGFAMGSNLPLFANGENDPVTGTANQSVTTSTGETKVIPGKADFGTLNSGGLY
ncbi:penicillin-binding protein 1A [Acidimangrovimonas pyrenivorans]|uniref:Penicillin-binding protein 1A n=1 Tax=Acidimangrovimonas pyrenivorans TaxID=2030798 RepID=A0ABV7AK77_9RHOB